MSAKTVPFGTPAFIEDFSDAALYQQWSDTMSQMTDVNIAADPKDEDNYEGCLAYDYVLANVKNPTLQYINISKAPHKDVPADQWASQPVEWSAFPRRITSIAPTPAECTESDSCPNNADPKGFFYYRYVNTPLLPYSGRVADEYCEWFVTRNAEGKVTQIEFTAEGPEYWQFLYDNDKPTLLRLYNEYSHPPAGYKITIEDLTLPNNNTWNGSRYNPNNLYNTKYGAVHLNCPPNSLGAEINLGARATVMRKDGKDAQITTPDTLCGCSQYGNPTRNSDPSIGAAVNNLATQGYLLSIKNPIGLYIKKFNPLFISAPNGEAPLTPPQLAEIVKLTRGQAADPNVPDSLMGLRYTLSIPEKLGLKYTVGDLLVNGVPITSGGQVAYACVKIGLVGAAYAPTPAPTNPMLYCRCVYEPYPLGSGRVCDLAFLPPAPPVLSVAGIVNEASAIAGKAASAVTGLAADVNEALHIVEPVQRVVRKHATR